MGSGKFSGYSCVKFVFFVFNVMFWLLGCAILGIGIWLHISKGSYASVAPSFNFLSATALCIAAGAIVLVVGFFGCCGAIMENPCMLLTYFCCMLVICAMEIVGASLIAVFKDQVGTALRKELRTGLQTNYNKTGQEGLTLFWTKLQTSHKCCGVNGPQDWQYIGVPKSCLDPSLDMPYSQGCWDTVKNCTVDNMAPLIAATAVTIILQIAGMSASVGMFCHMRNFDKNYIPIKKSTD